MAKNIVILTMGLDIGGAETHIVELAGALRQKGHKVTIFSNGGAFTARLKEMDVNHIEAPMNNKKMSSLFRSYKILFDFCRNERVSVIHSHTRITNFIAHLICKKLHIPMVTTVHFNFKLNILTKMFSRWGTRSLAVSEDLRKYVSDGYGIDLEKVRITVNGINLNTFSKKANPELRQEYGLTDEHKVILCVSRIDTGACENVFRFLESAKEIYDSVPQGRIVIVGNGNRFEELKQLAKNLNSVTTDNFVQLAGARTNIADYLHMADAFAGVSRSALEAMACRLPTIIIGNQGYLGVYSEEILPACIDTNFTCRGYAYVSSHEVAEIMIDMLTHPEHFNDNIEQAHKLIEERYSVVAMADDALASYNEAQDDLRPNDLMISGYYGTHNFGDDITLKAIIDNVSKHYPIKKITILNHQTNDAPDPRVEMVHRFNIWKILPLMKKTKLFMLGGGSLLQDVTSNRSLFFYLFMLRHAKKSGCKTMIYANGIGPIIQPTHQKRVNKILRQMDKITIRDTISYDYLLKHGFTEQDILLTADEAYSYDYNKNSSLPTDYPNTNKSIILINLRPCNNHPADFCSNIASALNNICKKYDLFPILMPVQFGQDILPLKKVSDLLTVEHHLFNNRLIESEIIAAIQKCDYLLTERLHPLVFALRMQKPSACIIYDPKVAATADRFKINDYALQLKDLSTQKIETILTDLIENKATISTAVKPIAEAMYVASSHNSKTAGKLLGE